MSKHIKTILTKFDRKFDIYSESVKVHSHSKQLATYVQGSGGGGYVHNGYGNTSNITINTTVVPNDYLTVIGNNEKQFSLHLVNYDVIVNQNDTLLLVWYQEKNADFWDYFAVYNENTSKLYIQKQSVQNMFSIPFTSKKGQFFWTISYMPSFIKSILKIFTGQNYDEPGLEDSQKFIRLFNINDYR